MGEGIDLLREGTGEYLEQEGKRVVKLESMGVRRVLARTKGGYSKS